MQHAPYSSNGRALVKTKTPGVYKRGGRYVVIVRGKKYAAKTMLEARALKASLTTDHNRGEFRQLSRVTFTEYANAWIDSYTGRTKRGIGPDTRADYRRALERHAIPFFGEMRLTAIGPRDIREYAARVGASGVSRGTVRLALAPVKALLATAYEDELIRSNPAAGLRNILPADEVGAEEAEKVKALTEAELARLLTGTLCRRCGRLDEPVDGCSECARWRLFFEFLAHSGLRIGEAIEARYGDIDGTWLRVDRRFYRDRVAKPKGRKTRRVRLSEEMARKLWVLRKASRARDEDLIFTAEQGGRVDQSNLMRRVLKPAAVEAGLGEWVKGRDGALRADSWVGFHTFRHSCATMLFRQGWNASQVQKFLGHSDAGFTLRRYVHLLDDDLPSPDFMDAITSAKGGKQGATSPAETGRNAEVAAAAG